MPRGDGTGPAGAGPMSGRAAGICAGNYAPGYANRNPRFRGPRGGGAWGWGGQGGGAMGWGAWGGYGSGFGRGARVGYDPDFEPVQAPRPVSEERALKREASALRRHLADVEARLGSLADGDAGEATDDEDEAGEKT